MDKDLEKRASKSGVFVWMKSKGYSPLSYLEKNNLPDELEDTLGELILFREVVTDLYLLNHDQGNIKEESIAFALQAKGVFEKNEAVDNDLRDNLINSVNLLYDSYLANRSRS